MNKELAELKRCPSCGRGNALNLYPGDIRKLKSIYIYRAEDQSSNMATYFKNNIIYEATTDTDVITATGSGSFTHQYNTYYGGFLFACRWCEWEIDVAPDFKLTGKYGDDYRRMLKQIKSCCDREGEGNEKFDRSKLGKDRSGKGSKDA